MQVSNRAVVRLTSVEVAAQVLRYTCGLLSSKNRWHELGDAGRVLFLVNHIVSDDKIRILLLAALDVIQNLGHVRLSDHLVAGQDQRHIKVRHTLLNFFDDAIDHGELVEQVNWIILTIDLRPSLVGSDLKQTASRMT